MEEVHLTTIKPRNNVLLLAQEISFAKVLACNDKRLRDRGLRRLKKWFMARSQGSMDFTREDHMRIWKGLFYCMWMSDKPLIQEELAEEISNLVHSFASFKASLLFVETFFASLSVEWFGIDQLRLDKFMMLVRRFMRQSLELVSRLDWQEEQVQQLSDVYYRTLISAPMGLSMHFIEVFCEELAKVGKGKLSSTTILKFITVFARVMATLKDGRLISQITRCVFLHLIRQTDVGVEHHMKFSAWKEYGFPGGDVNAAEKIEVDSDSGGEEIIEGSEDELEEEEREVGIDARAGKVDVLLPPLDFDCKQLLIVLRELRNKKETTTKARKTLIQLLMKFEKLAEGKYPLGLHKVDLPSKVNKKKEITQAAKRLLIEEENVQSDDEEAKLSVDKKAGKKKKRTLKHKKPVWEVSEADDSVSNSLEKKKSWEISEAATKMKSNKIIGQSKKRKLDEEENNISDVSKTKTKKLKGSKFSVSDSKENSFLSPAASTPKNINNKNVLRKAISNSQNISVQEKKPTPKGNINSKNKKRLKQTESKIATKSGEVNNTETNRVEIAQETSDSSCVQISTENQSNVERKSTELQQNTSTTGKNNGWGGEWDEPVENLEYEIFIPNKKYVEKRKSLGLPYPLPSFVSNSAEKDTSLSRLKRKSKNLSLSTPNSQKKVEFNLSANCSQEYKEYTRKVKSSKKQIPFDATKKPVQGLLKNSTPSPINPFYKKKLNFLKSPSKG